MPNKQKTKILGSFIIQTPTTYTSGLIDANNDDDLLSFPENIDNSLQSECNIIESVPQIILHRFCYYERNKDFSGNG